MDKIIIIIIGIGMYIASYFPEWHAPAIVALFGLAMIAGYSDDQYSKNSDEHHPVSVGGVLTSVVTLIVFAYFIGSGLASGLKGVIIVFACFAAFYAGYPFVKNMVNGLLRLARWFITKVEKMERNLENEIH